jgi:hypothetical protein
MLEAVNMRTGLWRDHRTRFPASDGQSFHNPIQQGLPSAKWSKPGTVNSITIFRQLFSGDWLTDAALKSRVHPRRGAYR